MDNFEDIVCIGAGAYGRVYSGIRKSDGRRVAIKKVKSSRRDGIHSTTLREIGLLKTLNHPNIVRLLEIVPKKKSLLLVFEHIDCDLKHFITARSFSIQSSLIKRFMFQLIKGVAYLHSNRILHRDLKSQNILVDAEGFNIKIADFGLSRIVSVPSRPYTHEVVTLWYRAPEVLLGMETYSFAIDIWSVGCIFAELIMKEPLFRGQSEIDQILKIFRVVGTPNEDAWPGIEDLPFYLSSLPQWKPQSLQSLTKSSDSNAIDLLSKMLRCDPSRRIMANDALNHKYFSDVNIGAVTNEFQPLSILNQRPSNLLQFLPV